MLIKKTHSFKLVIVSYLELSKTFKDKPQAYRKDIRKPKEGRRIESSKGRKNINLKQALRNNKNLEDYFI